ncbi:MAG: HAD family hydrolase [Myxococcota bacterium]|nr:HAD family hydrolase [Myxococcota bacterium]
MSYAPLHRSPEQTRVLEAVLATAAPGKVIVLDLDGCLFDARNRQVHILREYGARFDVPALYRVQEQHFTSWLLPETFEAAGIDPGLAEPLQDFWFERFFSGEYCVFDHAMPGAVAFVRKLHNTGAEVVYLTGRHREMHEGTEAALRRAGFPYDLPRTRLITKPQIEIPDAEFKGRALETIAQLGHVVAFMDNEPTNVNLFHAMHPEALVVWLDTDHSPRPVRPVASLPRIKGFLM